MSIPLYHSFFGFELNCRMPNGTHGGVRGQLNSPYSIHYINKNMLYFTKEKDLQHSLDIK